MYTPPAFREDDPQELHAIMRAARLSTLVTATDAGLMATPLPFIRDETEGEDGTLYGHLARANGQWNTPATGEALVIFAGPDAYVSPGWYASKREHGKVVPTWNYSTVHLRGTVTVHDDSDFLRDVVTRLTDAHESASAEPWAVSDAPDDYVTKQLRAIVGVEIQVAEVEAKAKLSQNRSEADRSNVVSGLSAGTPEETVVAEQMRRAL